MKRRQFVFGFVMMWVVAAVLTGISGGSQWRLETERLQIEFQTACAIEVEESAGLLIEALKHVPKLGHELVEKIKRIDAACKKIDGFFGHLEKILTTLPKRLTARIAKNDFTVNFHLCRHILYRAGNCVTPQQNAAQCKRGDPPAKL